MATPLEKFIRIDLRQYRRKNKNHYSEDEVTGASQTLQVFDTDSFSHAMRGLGEMKPFLVLVALRIFQCDTFCNSQ